MFRAWVPLRWYTALLLPPALVLTVLLLLERFVSPVYAPNHFFVGLLFGIPAGFLEEIGWMGYAFPKMRSESSGLVPSILLGAAVGLLAPACDQLSWHRDTAWCILEYRNRGTPYAIKMYRNPIYLLRDGMAERAFEPTDVSAVGLLLGPQLLLPIPKRCHFCFAP
jgi:hypothetical protein